MKRTTKVSDRVTYSINEEPIVLSKSLLDLLLTQPNPSDLTSLYVFYYYTAKWQKTNQLRATTKYTAKALGWPANKVRKVKQQLKDLQLVKDIASKNSANRYTGHYIQLQFIWKTDSILTDFQSLENREGNALSSNREKKKNNKKSSSNYIEYFSPDWQKDNKFQKILQEYITHRKEKRSSLTQTAAKRLANKLQKYHIDIAIEALKHSIENGWTGVFPESIKTKSTALKDIPVVKSPSEIIHDQIPDGFQKSMERTYEKIEQSISNDADKSQFATNLCQLYKWLVDEQSSKAKNRGAPSPTMILGEYVTWIQRQKWLEDIKPNLFTPRHKIFEMFFHWISQQNRINIFTGNFYKS